MKRIQDSLSNDLVIYLDSLQAYEQAINVIKNPIVLNKHQLISYKNLLKKREHVKFSLDSLKLTVAVRYNTNDQTDKAEVLLNELLTSSYHVIRNKAALVLDSLVTDKNKSKLENYVYNPVSEILKPIIPLIILLALPTFAFFLYHRSNNWRYFAIYCNDAGEKTAFKLAFKLTLDEMQSQQHQNTNNSTVVQPGSLSTLPHLVPELTLGLVDAMEGTLPDNYLKLIAWIWRLGIAPRNVLTIFIEKDSTDLEIKSNLKINKRIIAEWNLQISTKDLFDTRMDMVYGALIRMDIFSRNSP